MNIQNIGCCEGAVKPEPKEPLSELINKVVTVGNENLAVAKLLNNHIFGDSNDNVAPKKDPMCIENVIEEHFDTLKELHEVLVKMAEKLGCLR